MQLTLKKTKKALIERGHKNIVDDDVYLGVTGGHDKRSRLYGLGMIADTIPKGFPPSRRTTQQQRTQSTQHDSEIVRLRAENEALRKDFEERMARDEARDREFAQMQETLAWLASFHPSVPEQLRRDRGTGPDGDGPTGGAGSAGLV